MNKNLKPQNSDSSKCGLGTPRGTLRDKSEFTTPITMIPRCCLSLPHSLISAQESFPKATQCTTLQTECKRS